MGFRDDFLWGTASASYQIEGAAYEDGKGLSVWDMFCKKEGAIHQGQNGDVACDHYHRYKEDIALMKKIGLNSYRFSISWPRVIPEGTGKVNQKGLDFYNALVDELIANNIEPLITLFHWDFPHELFLRDGWLNPDSPKWFEDYTQVVAKTLGDRINYWITLNEPQVFVHRGHVQGTRAPGLKMQPNEILQISHNVLLAHGRSVQSLRNNCTTDCQIGYAPVGMPAVPNDPNNRQDIAAAKMVTFAVKDDPSWSHSWWMDPVFLGEYPPDALERFAKAMPEIGPDDMKIISQPLDFFGVNTYTGQIYAAGDDGTPKQVSFPDGQPVTAMNWPLLPQTLYWGPKFFYERYGKPIIVTENGMANLDWIALDGKVHDPARIDLLTRYLRQLQRAAQDGVDIRGYFQWSLTDNFEWAEGFSKRFGLVYVDYSSQKRVMKDSAYWYKDVIAANGDNL